MYRWASLIVLIAIILVIGVLFFRILASFFVPLFMATILVVVFQPVYRWILAKCKGRTRTSALLTTIAAMLIVFLPMVIVVVLAVSEGVALVSKTGLEDVPKRIQELRVKLHLDMPYEYDIRRVELAMAALVKDASSNQLVENRKIDNTIDALRELIAVLNSEHANHKDRLEQIVETLNSAKSRDEEKTDGDQQGDARRDDEKTTFDQQADIRSAQITFQQFKTEIMGGPLWRSVKEFANPSESERQAMTENLITLMQDKVLPVGGATIGVIVQWIMGACITAIALYFFLADGPKMVETIMRLSPLDDKYEQELLREFSVASRAVVLATLLAAAAQGVLAGIGFWVAGVESVFLLGLLTALFGIVPFVGATAVWGPVALWLFFVEERMWAAILLGVYGAVVVSQIDNLVKPLVLHGQSQLHPLLALLSVLGGVQSLGPVGILVGPMIVVCMQTLLNMLQRELVSLDARRVKKAT
jgi:predicted PurR-regulated permease PerM